MSQYLAVNAQKSKQERIRDARERYENRATTRPIQVTSPSTEHVVGWEWPKVSDATLNQMEEMREEL